MPVLQESTREQLRTGIGYLLGAVKILEADASGSTTTFLTDDIAIMTADDPNGKWLVFTSGSNNDGQIRQITNSTVSSNRVTLTFFPAITDATANSDTAELWDQWYDPVAIHNFINQAQIDATGYIYDPVEDISLHSGGALRYDIPTNFEMLQGVYVRTGMDSEVIIEAGEVWNESVDSDFTVTQDDSDKLFGRVATKFVVAGSVSAGDLVSQKIASLDISGKDFIEFPIKVRTAVVASDLVLRLSAAANGANTDKIIAIPALSAQVETWVRVAMSEAVSGFDPSECTAIISVALEYNANNGANTIWIGRIDATRNDSYEYTLVDNSLWYIAKEARDLVFKSEAQDGLGYRLIKLVGGDVPAQLNADATVTEVPESFIIYHAAGLALRRPIRGESTDQARERRSQANDNLGIAAGYKSAFPMLVNLRKVT
jgi:hypothetical protein